VTRDTSARLLTRVRGTIARSVRGLGYEIVRLAPPTEARRRRLAVLRELGIDLVIDVGANDGAFGRELRADGYKGRIVSFEPTSAAFAALAAGCADDPHWEARNVALGAEEGEATMNLSRNSSSSSLLAMDGRHEATAPEAAYVGTESVELARLDSFAEELAVATAAPYLKLDVQGYELEVCRGAAETLAAAKAVECELSFLPLYEQQPLFTDVVEWLRSRGLVLAGLEAVHADPRTSELLQVNGLFVRAG
jgi:FkbM family methyltransferase